MATIRSRTRFTPNLVSLAIASCFTTGTALANPTNPTVVHGAASFSNPAANILNVQTLTPQTVINWGSFSINVGELTRIMQPSAASAVLNRVAAGASPSSILGALQSNGRVFLINPNGILFGAGAQIDVAGLVASTLNMSDADFLGGRLRFTDGLGKSVVNDGSIATGAGGSVYLIGSGVANSGIIRSPQGEVVLAAGNSVELVSPGTPNLRVEIAAADNEARNLGQIISDAGRIGIYAGLINNSGTIRADSAVAEGGHILLKATKSATLESTSVLSAQGQGGGRIDVLADESVRVAGRLDVSAPIAGDGGFIETSAARVTIDPAMVVTGAAPHGKAGTWLIDPGDFRIAPAGGDITGLQISTTLNNADVTIASNPQVPGNGDIFVDDAISWSTTNSLILDAVGFVQVSKPITGPNGGVFLNSGAGVMQTSEGAIAANQLYANGGTGGVQLSVASNMVNTLAGDATGSFSFTNGKSLTVGSMLVSQVTESGIQVFGASPASINVNVTSGDLMVTSPISAFVSFSGSDAVGAPASVTLAAAGMITVANSSVQAFGGFGSNTGGSSTIAMTANGMTFENGDVWAGGFPIPNCDCSQPQVGGNGLVSLNALNGTLNLMNGAVVEAGGGMGSVSSGGAQINLLFTGRVTGGYVINGVESLIVDPDVRAPTGFFVNAMPAILDTNLLVTYTGENPFINPLVAAMNTQADVLADQLKAGETGQGEDKDKEKLPFCSS